MTDYGQSTVQSLLFNNGKILYHQSSLCLIAEHSHRAAQISVALVAGDARVLWRDKSKQRFANLRRNDVCVIPSWQPHTFEWHLPAEIVSFTFETDFLNRVAADLSPTSSIELVESYAKPDAFVQHLAGFVRAAIRGETILNKSLYAESAANVLAAHLLCKHNSALNSRRISRTTNCLTASQLKRAIDFIKSNSARHFTLSEVAGTVGLSSFHFARAFKISTGFAPHQFLVRLRLERAQELLTKTAFSITEIAAAVGYAHQSHFSTVFRRMTGVSPQKFRRQR